MRSTARRLSTVRPCLRCSRPIPPPSVRPATPVCPMTPTGHTRPWAWAALSSCDRWAPPSARARRATGSTVTARIRDMSSTIPPSQVENPATLCPPPRTATTICSSRANLTAAITSSTDEGRTIMDGRRSAIAFHTRRAWSYCGSPGAMTSPEIRSPSALLRPSARSDRGLRRRQPRHRHPERAARHVVQAEFVTQVDRVGVSPVLAADPDLHALACLATLGHSDAHQAAHALLVDRLERVAGQDLLLQVADDESPLRVVAREAERGLRQVVGAEGEELRLLRDLARRQSGARDLDHGAELVGHANPR